MWYKDPPLEDELAAIALIRAQISLFTPILEPFYPENPSLEWKIQEENFRTLLATSVNEGVVRALLTYMALVMRQRSTMEARLRAGLSPYADPLQREYSAETTTQEMLKELDHWMTWSIEAQRSGSGNGEPAA